MAKVERNVMVRGWSGSVGGVVFRQMKDGSTWVSATPDLSQRKFSQGQKKHQRRFKEAAAYARDAAKKQPIYAELAKGTVKNAYNMALSDWFNPLVVLRIERRTGKPSQKTRRRAHPLQGGRNMLLRQMERSRQKPGTCRGM